MAPYPLAEGTVVTLDNVRIGMVLREVTPTATTIYKVVAKKATALYVREAVESPTYIPSKGSSASMSDSWWPGRFVLARVFTGRKRK
jgi:hypothetical protein